MYSILVEVPIVYRHTDHTVQQCNIVYTLIKYYSDSRQPNSNVIINTKKCLDGTLCTILKSDEIINVNCYIVVL